MVRRAGTPFGVFGDPETVRGALNNFIARVIHGFFSVGSCQPANLYIPIQQEKDYMGLLGAAGGIQARLCWAAIPRSAREEW